MYARLEPAQKPKIHARVLVLCFIDSGFPMPSYDWFPVLQGHMYMPHGLWGLVYGCVNLESMIICNVISVFPSHSEQVRFTFTYGDGVVGSRVS